MGIGTVVRTAFRGVDGLAALGVVATAAAFGLGLLGREHWQADLLSHFRVQYVLALLLAGTYFLVRRRWFLLLPTLAVLAYAGWPVVEYFLPRDNGSVGHEKWQLRVMSLNVEASNGRGDLVKAAIEQANPDVVFLPEATATWAEALAPLRARYRYGTGDGAQGAFSLLLLSQLPIRDAQVIQLSDDGWPAVIARICPSEAADAKDCIAFVGIHPPPPRSESLAATRNAVLRAVPNVVAKVSPGPIIVAGDFNCTPWSPYFADLLAATGLHDSALGFGVWPTWNSSLLPLGIDIDHVLVADGVVVRNHKVGGDVGSDHLPVIVDLAY
jgi:endonuclease/exonuclease/phosphatase (EEP) superfamily protein YafD